MCCVRDKSEWAMSIANVFAFNDGKHCLGMSVFVRMCTRSEAVAYPKGCACKQELMFWSMLLSMRMFEWSQFFQPQWFISKAAALAILAMFFKQFQMLLGGRILSVDPWTCIRLWFVFCIGNNGPKGREVLGRMGKHSIVCNVYIFLITFSVQSFAPTMSVQF